MRSARIDDGTALERFRQMVEAQGGDPRVADDPVAVLPARARDRSRSSPTGPARSPPSTPRRSDGPSAALGAGRFRKGDPIDPAVGIVCTPKIGDRLEAGERDRRGARAHPDEAAREAAAAVLGAFTLVDGPVEPPPLVHADLG